jgi:hypothetical protein
MPLTMPHGYTITIGQFRNDKPTGVIECKLCPSRSTFDVPLDDVCGVGRVINQMIGAWLVHRCPGDVRSDMQDVPAVPVDGPLPW